ncbi:MAG: hypothetical protein M3Y09_02620 [Actinomycetota bacterium]|nr:hypothetical protein [Actinomycetota bacterium]
MLRNPYESYEWRCGCPIATVALDIRSDSATIREASAYAYRRWHEVIAQRLRRAGMEAIEADDHALLVLSATQGALILARTWQTTEPLNAVARQLAERPSTSPRAGS